MRLVSGEDSLSALAPARAAAAALRPRALIIEDDPDACEVLHNALRALGYEVRSALTVFQGLRAVASFKPTHVLLDLRFPDGQGTDVLALIRASNMQMRIALLTAAGPGDRVWDEALAFNPDAAFRKPWDLRRIIDWLKQDSPAPPGGRAPSSPPPLA